MSFQSLKLPLMAVCAAGSLLATSACDKGTTSDPSSALRGDLNPPGNLMSMTQPAASGLDLYWTNSNTEEDFKGYYVFAAKASVASLKSKVTYPESTDITKKSQFPRCNDNKDFFVAFGLPDMTEEADNVIDCEGDVTAETEEGDEFAVTGGRMMADGEEGGATPEALKNFVPCYDGDTKLGTDALSYPSEPLPDNLGTVKCTIKKAWDGTELAPLEDGEVYTIFVVAVAKDDYSTISWTSNVIEDSPSLDAFGDEVTIPKSKFVVLSFNPTTFAVTVEAAELCPGSDNDGPCAVTGSNAEATNGIFIGRDDKSTSRVERLFISASEDSANEFEVEQVTNSSAPRIVGDEPATHSYSAKGTKFQVLENAIFDFKWTTGGETRYGKVAFGSISYADDDQEGDATVKVSVVLQKGADVPHYFQ